MENTIFKLLVIAGLILVAFYGGRFYAHQLDKNHLDQMFIFTKTCDLQELDTVIEVDCLTPESYEIYNKYF